ncbi:Uncharacterised protein [Streptococcus pneumoniae]|nr:Uncharacterised protein [Streptococcus pneumoniae]CMX42074.1 Uncharacterised protein [Streptococcus pneumoniae]
MSQSSYLSPLLWLKKEADKEKMARPSARYFSFTIKCLSSYLLEKAT